MLSLFSTQSKGASQNNNLGKGFRFDPKSKITYLGSTIHNPLIHVRGWNQKDPILYFWLCNF